MTAFNSFKSEVTSMTMASVQEQKPVARQENTKDMKTLSDFIKTKKLQKKFLLVVLLVVFYVYPIIVLMEQVK